TRFSCDKNIDVLAPFSKGVVVFTSVPLGGGGDAFFADGTTA
ncbi:hypothetical protein SAMN05216582_14312, partial [Selenomonas ruminantium]